MYYKVDYVLKCNSGPNFDGFRAAEHLRKKVADYMTLIRQVRNLECKVAESDEEDRFGGDVFR